MQCLAVQAVIGSIDIQCFINAHIWDTILGIILCTYVCIFDKPFAKSLDKFSVLRYLCLHLTCILNVILIKGLLKGSDASQHCTCTYFLFSKIYIPLIVDMFCIQTADCPAILFATSCSWATCLLLVNCGTRN